MERESVHPLWESMVRQARERLSVAGYPVPSKPDVPLEELRLPTDVERLTSIQLANLMLKLQSWHAYSTAQLAFAKSDLAALAELFDVELGRKMHSIAEYSDGRPTKDVLKGLALNDERLHKVHLKKISLEQTVQNVIGIVQSLDIQCKALVNEQIRRHAAQKVEGGNA